MGFKSDAQRRAAFWSMYNTKSGRRRSHIQSGRTNRLLSSVMRPSRVQLNNPTSNKCGYCGRDCGVNEFCNVDHAAYYYGYGNLDGKPRKIVDGTAQIQMNNPSPRYRDGDYFCARCGEPWDAYGLRNGDVTPDEREKFMAGQGCPSCHFGNSSQITVDNPVEKCKVCGRPIERHSLEEMNACSEQYNSEEWFRHNSELKMNNPVDYGVPANAPAKDGLVHEATGTIIWDEPEAPMEVKEQIAEAVGLVVSEMVAEQQYAEAQEVLPEYADVLQEILEDEQEHEARDREILHELKRKAGERSGTIIYDKPEALPKDLARFERITINNPEHPDLDPNRICRNCRRPFSEHDEVTGGCPDDYDDTSEIKVNNPTVWDYSNPDLARWRDSCPCGGSGYWDYSDPNMARWRCDRCGRMLP